MNIKLRNQQRRFKGRRYRRNCQNGELRVVIDVPT